MPDTADRGTGCKPRADHGAVTATLLPLGTKLKTSLDVAPTRPGHEFAEVAVGADARWRGLTVGSNVVGAFVLKV